MNSTVFYRIFYPVTKECTFYSTAFRSYITPQFGKENKFLQIKKKKIETTAYILHDHSVIYLKLAQNISKE